MALEFASLDNKQRNSTAAPFGVAMNPSGVSSPSLFSSFLRNRWGGGVGWA